MAKNRITRNEFIAYSILFILIFVGGLVLMALDNTQWITASPEWDSDHTVCNSLGCWRGGVQNYSTPEFIDYMIKYRIYTVFTHPRDLIAVIIYSSVITFIVVFSRELIFKGKKLKKIVRWLNK